MIQKKKKKNYGPTKYAVLEEHLNKHQYNQ
jgi:hypothetical protein